MIRLSLIRRDFRPFQVPITGIYSIVNTGSDGEVGPYSFRKSEQTSTRSNSFSDFEIRSRTLPSELLHLMLRGDFLSERVLFQLAQAETKELDPWLRDDIRIAWLCVLHCAQGIASPWEFAFWRYLGKHPDKLIPEFVARAARHAAMEVGADTRLTPSFLRTEKTPAREMVGSNPADSRIDYKPAPALLYQSAAEEIALPPKKSVESVTRERKEKTS